MGWMKGVNGMCLMTMEAKDRLVPSVLTSHVIQMMTDTRQE